MSDEEINPEETLFEFPCEFPVKAMGKTCTELENSCGRNHESTRSRSR